MKVLATDEYERLLAIERAHKDQQKVHRKNQSDLRKQHGEATDKLKQDHFTEVSGLKEKIRNLEGRNAELTNENSVLVKLKNDATTVKTLTLELEEREKLVKTQEDNVEKQKVALDDEEKGKYRSGYEDGVADGLRKGYDLTAQDRQQMAQIAALAAASHSDGASQTLAKEIAKSITHALPAGATKS
jgi:hypothetical protein